ncbi:MAG: transketolase [Planctomycetes bacterium]|nr:transketolase [Planctomycetota bacterium]
MSLTIDELKAKALQIRRDAIGMIAAAGSGHPGGSLSEADLLAALWFRVMKHDPKNPQWAGRDRFILSKGHGCPSLYSAMAHAGYFDPAILPTLRKLGSPLQGHPDRRFIPALEASTGSLGNGLSIGIGIAHALKLDRSDARVWVMLGDGECQEGQVWEASMYAGAHRMENLTAIVDYNKKQLDDMVKHILPLDPLGGKFAAMNWHVLEIDGHNMAMVVEALEESRKVKGRPVAVIAHTITGKGVSFMENDPKWHGVAPTKEEATRALAELGV